QQRRKDYEAKIAELEKSSQELEVLILKKVAASKGTKVKGTGVLAWPAEGRITSRYGYRRHPLWGGRNFHRGIDIAAKHGTPIKAADAGEIIFAGWWDGYGKAIVIDHGQKTTTVYGHMSRLYKKVGQAVAKGQTIGLMGSTGYSTGPHVHFEVRKSGKPTDPMPYLN
ncbi:MAG: M23 family metallopeptidase, partial [bacterium]